MEYDTAPTANKHSIYRVFVDAQGDYQPAWEDIDAFVPRITNGAIPGDKLARSLTAETNNALYMKISGEYSMEKLGPYWNLLKGSVAGGFIEVVDLKT
jgi:hypothetical protein